MIVLLHVATGGLAGAATGSRRRAAAIGPLLHLACDAVPHEDILPLPRPGGRQLFPSHRWARALSGRGIPAWAQLAAAGVIIGRLARPRRR